MVHKVNIIAAKHEHHYFHCCHDDFEYLAQSTTVPTCKYSLTELVTFCDTIFFLSPCRNSTVLNSKVLSVAIKPSPASLSAPVVVEFSHLYNVSNKYTFVSKWFQKAGRHCVFCFFLILICDCSSSIRAQPIRPVYPGMRVTGKRSTTMLIWPCMHSNLLCVHLDLYEYLKADPFTDILWTEPANRYHFGAGIQSFEIWTFHAISCPMFSLQLLILM